MYEAYSTPAFEEQYTYHGTDLGAIWTPEKTAFRLWAPTAEDVTINLYRSGGTDHTGPMSGCGGNLAIPVFNGITEEEFTTLRERRLG